MHEDHDSLSVLLPTLNDEWRLGTQLDAILNQLRDQDEVILLLDGSNARTVEIAESFDCPQLRKVSNKEPSGVCEAYNQCFASARGNWVIGASGNDEWQPGTIDAFADAVEGWPDAKLIIGHVMNMTRQGFSQETCFVEPCNLLRVWSHDGFRTHGAAVFLHRSVWGKGYIPALGWMADFWQALCAACRHGYIDLKHEVSYVHFLKNSFCGGQGDPDFFNAVVRAAGVEVAKPFYDDIRAMIAQYHEITDFFAEKPITCIPE